MVVSAKVPPSVRADLEALAMAFPMSDGSRGNLSAGLRAWLMQGKALYDVARVARVRAAADVAGVTTEEMWARLVDDGLRSTEGAK